MQPRQRPLGLFHLPCSVEAEPPTAEAIEANRRLRLRAFALHALAAGGALAAGSWLLGWCASGFASASLIACMASVALSLALGAYCLAQAGAPLPPELMPRLAALCDEHPQLDAYRRRVVAQGRFFCKEEFPMLVAAAHELSLRPAFMRLYLVGVPGARPARAAAPSAAAHPAPAAPAAHPAPPASRPRAPREVVLPAPASKADAPPEAASEGVVEQAPLPGAPPGAAADSARAESAAEA